MDNNVLKRYINWVNNVKCDNNLIEELRAIKMDDKEIEDRFYKDLEFGTGGLRGIMGAGTNRINIYTIGKATQGLSYYLNKHFKFPSVAIAYDSRKKSKLFAEHAAKVLAANAIKVYLYSELMPTPALSFAVRYLNCSAGIVITASHNPCQYNGYKVYGSDGCQITLKAAKEILSEIAKLDEFSDVRGTGTHELTENDYIEFIDKSVISAFLSAVSSQSINKNIQNKSNLKIVYTPLNGAGLRCVTSILLQNGYTNLSVVESQREPDGNFSTCPYPNPEERSALKEGLNECKKSTADILLATDPDCDRVGVAVKHKDNYILLSGNEIGVLLFDYICKMRINTNSMPRDPVCIKTIVTTDMVLPIAKNYGVKVVETLTGFKFIGEQIGVLEKNNQQDRYVFGFEESYGYLSGTHVKDKDAVNSSLLICEMATYYKNMEKTLIDTLNDLHVKYGYYMNTLKSFSFEGKSNQNKLKRFMDNLRGEFKFNLNDKNVVSVCDYLISKQFLSDGTSNGINLPKSNVIKLIFNDGTSVTIRPSGTEPKLKIYTSVVGNSKNSSKMLVKQVNNYFSNLIKKLGS